MSARERLAWQLRNPGLVGLDEEETTELLDAYAHELAEEIRKAWTAHNPRKPGNVCMLSALNAADLIDPSAGPVRTDEEPTP